MTSSTVAMMVMKRKEAEGEAHVGADDTWRRECTPERPNTMFITKQSNDSVMKPHITDRAHGESKSSFLPVHAHVVLEQERSDEAALLEDELASLEASFLPLQPTELLKQENAHEYATLEQERVAEKPAFLPVWAKTIFEQERFDEDMLLEAELEEIEESFDQTESHFHNAPMVETSRSDAPVKDALRLARSCGLGRILAGKCSHRGRVIHDTVRPDTPVKDKWGRARSCRLGRILTGKCSHRGRYINDTVRSNAPVKDALRLARSCGLGRILAGKCGRRGRAFRNAKRCGLGRILAGKCGSPKPRRQPPRRGKRCRRGRSR